MTPQEFDALTADVAYAERGMFFSEVYLFTMACRKAGVERIIESGVRNGVSTRLLRALWPGRVTSIEVKPGRVPDALQASLLVGDAMDLLPQLLRDDPTPTGVLIDGPKREKAQQLRDICLQVPSARVVAVHDIRMGRGERQHSHDATWRAAVGNALDKRIPDAIRSLYPLGAPGLGVWVNA